MENQNVMLKVAWRLKELASVSGLSVSFLRKEIREGRLPAKRAGTAVLVLDSDFKRYLESSADGTGSHSR
jgi:excisionase family DNA binding protein